MARPTRLQKVLDRLTARQGELVGGPPRDAWAAVLWENVVGPTDEARRDEALAALQAATGLDPQRILALPAPRLQAICGNARTAAQHATAVRACCEAFARVGDPRHLVAAEPAIATAHLLAFPGVDAATAARILLFAGYSERLAFDEHGLRAIVRIGYGDEAADPATLRRTAEDAAAAELLDNQEVRIDAVLRLRRLGLTACTRRAHCDACPVGNLCEVRRLEGKNR